MSLPYMGNGYYCYANSLQMILRHAGAPQPDPGFLECLTTMPWGHTYLRLADGPLIFFSSPDMNPDTGLTLAIKTLGWRAREHFGGSPETALEQLQSTATHGPILVGPVDLGHLTYNPNHRNLAGIDHFAVVTAIGEDHVTLHDPAGFPCATLPREDFLQAWQADRVPYKRGSFTCRWGFEPEQPATRAEMVASTLEMVRRVIAVNPSGPVVYGGTEALALLAQDLRREVPPGLAAHLIWFALPLAARRALDGAAFFAEAGELGAAAIQADKARLHGRANYLAVQRQWGEVADLIDQLATLEEKLITALSD